MLRADAGMIPATFPLDEPSKGFLVKTHARSQGSWMVNAVPLPARWRRAAGRGGPR